jgi:hypothetical protein
MPDPDTTNRERLLRLIDGGTEALKEFHAEETPKKAPVVTKVPAASSARLLAFGRGLREWKKKLPAVSRNDALLVFRWLVLLGALLAALHYGLEALKTVKGPQAPDGTLPVQSPEDGSGVGLRLVGVDSSGPPVALLEDVKTGKTYFARVNERVKDARVKHIEKKKVLVTVRGKTVELR